MGTNQENQDVIQTDLFRCSRCGLDHSRLIFQKFTRPIIDLSNTEWSHWTMCPTLHEPIILHAQTMTNHTDPSLKKTEQEAIDHLE